MVLGGPERIDDMRRNIVVVHPGAVLPGIAGQFLAIGRVGNRGQLEFRILDFRERRQLINQGNEIGPQQQGNGRQGHQ